MFLNRLINQGNAPVLEQLLKFTANRHKLIALPGGVETITVCWIDGGWPKQQANRLGTSTNFVIFSDWSIGIM